MQNPPPPPPGNLPPPPPPGGFPPPPPPPGGYVPPPPPGAGYPVPGGYQPAPQAAYGYAPQARYGGFWIRFVAVFIDGIIVSVPIFILALILGVIIGAAVGVSGNDNTQATNAASTTAGGLAELLGFVISVSYFVYFWGRGATLGQRLFHLRVVDATTGAPIGYGRAALRYVGYLLSVVVCYIGLIWAAFDSRKQGWHDKIASTVVLQD